MIIPLLTGTFLSLLVTTALGSELSEIELIDKPDETRNDCIDIKGCEESIKVHKGLQAHACYSYQGQFGIDQAFDKGLIQFGKFYLPAFDVCMKSKNNNEKQNLTLKDCVNTAVTKI